MKSIIQKLKKLLNLLKTQPGLDAESGSEGSSESVRYVPTEPKDTPTIKWLPDSEGQYQLTLVKAPYVPRFREIPRDCLPLPSYLPTMPPVKVPKPKDNAEHSSASQGFTCRQGWTRNEDLVCIRKEDSPNPEIGGGLVTFMPVQSNQEGGVGEIRTWLDGPAFDQFSIGTTYRVEISFTTKVEPLESPCPKQSPSAQI